MNAGSTASPLPSASVFLNGHAIPVKPQFNAGRLRFLAIEVDAEDCNGDNQAADDQVESVVLLHESQSCLLQVAGRAIIRPKF